MARAARPRQSEHLTDAGGPPTPHFSRNPAKSPPSNNKPLTPAASPACTSLRRSPTMNDPLRTKGKVSNASSSIPGKGFRHRHDSNGPCGHQQIAASGASIAASRAAKASWKRSKASWVKSPRPTPDWFVASIGTNPFSRNRRIANTAPATHRIPAGSQR